MGEKVIPVTLKTVADVQDVLQNAQRIQGALNQLKLPDNLKGSFEKTFKELEKYAANTAQQLATGFKNKGDVTTFERNVKGLVTTFEKLSQSFKNVTNNEEILKNSFKDGVDIEKFKQLTSELEKINEELSGLRTDQLTKVEDALKTAANEARSSAKSWEDFRQAIAEGNMAKAHKALQNLHNGLNRINTETEEGAKRYAAYEQAVKILDQVYEELTNTTSEYVKKLDEQYETQSKLDNLSDENVKEKSGQMKQLAENTGEVTEGTKQWAKSEIDAANAQQQVNSTLDQFKSKIAYFFGAANAVNLFKRAVRSAFETVKDLDKVMTETAVVTEFSVGDMWSQLPEYTQRANELGVSIHSAYEAATLYYQQGLETNQVVAISNETLKMARIASLDAATATDRMTNALRGFNMEINESNAKNINDVYSKLAAITASNVDEISTAMTKVASLANNANMSFENTSAFLAQIIETTRESAETAGTALKTVIARFSEVKKLVDKGLLTGKDSEDEIIDVNKVSQALRTAGINLNEYLTGMKGLDEIFIELASKWDTLDNVQQRYIATMAAGSRQQSRFIALMSDYARTTELVNAANNATGASQEQFNKTLESLESKLNRLKNSWDSFTMGLADNQAIKVAVDILTDLIESINKITAGLPGITNGIAKIALVLGSAKLVKPILNKLLASVSSMFVNNAKTTGKQAGVQFSTSFSESIKTSGLQGLKEAIHNIFWISEKELQGGMLEKAFRNSTLTEQQQREVLVTFRDKGADAAIEHLTKIESKIKEINGKEASIGIDIGKLKTALKEVNAAKFNFAQLGTTISSVGMIVMGIGSFMSILGLDEDTTKWITGIGMAFTTLGGIIAAAGHLAQNGWGWITVVVTAAIAVISAGIAIYNHLENQKPEKKLEQAKKAAEEAAEAARKAQSEYEELLSAQSTYNGLRDQIKELTKGTNEWREAVYKLNQQVLQLASTYEGLRIISDEEGILSIDPDSWTKVEQQMKQQVASHNFGVFAADLNQASAQRNVDRNIGSASGYNNLKGSKDTTAEHNLFYQLFDSVDGVSSELIEAYGRYRGEALINSFNNRKNKLKSKTQETSNRTWAWWDYALAAVLPGFGGIRSSVGNIWDGVVNFSEGGSKNKVKSIAKALNISYDENATYEELLNLVTAYDTKQAFIEAAKMNMQDKNIRALISNDLDAINKVISQNITEQYENSWVENLIEDRKQEIDELSIYYRSIFGQDVQTLFGTDKGFTLAKELQSTLNLLSSGDTGATVLAALVGVGEATHYNGFAELAESLLDVNFDSAIEGCADLNSMIENGTDAQRAFAISFLVLKGSMYNATAQANEFWKSIDDDTRKDLLKDGQIAADELRELAAESSSLQKVLDNTGVSVNTLATYYNLLNQGILNASSSITDFVSVLDEAMKAQNAMADTFNLIDTWKPGRSGSEVHKFLEDTIKQFNELKEMGLYSDQAIIDIEKLFFGDNYNGLLQEFEGDMQKMAETLSAEFAKIGTNFYGWWKEYSNMFKDDAFSLNEDNGNIDIDVSKIESVDQVIQNLMHDLGWSKEVAEAMFSDLMESSDKFRMAMDRISAANAFNELVENGLVLGNMIHYDEAELEIVASKLGISVEELKGKIVGAFREIEGYEINFGKLLDENGKLDPNSKLFIDLRNNIEDAARNGFENTKILAETYEILLNTGMDTTQARETLNDLWTDANTDFKNMRFKFNDKTLEISRMTLEREAEYDKETFKDKVSAGILEATEDKRIAIEQQISANEYGKKIGAAVAAGVIAGTAALNSQKAKDLVNNSLLGKVYTWATHGKKFSDTEAFSKISNQVLQSQMKAAQANIDTYFDTSDLEAELEQIKKELAKETKKGTVGDLINTEDNNYQDLIDKMNQLYGEIRQDSLINLDKAKAYQTELAQQVGDDIEDAGKGIEGELKNINKGTKQIYELPEKPLIDHLDLMEPLTELVNVNERINENLRERTKLEREYDKLIRNENTTIDQMRNAYFGRLENLQQAAREQYTRKETASALIEQLKNRKYFIDENNFQTYAQLGVADMISFDGNKIVKDIVAINSIEDKNIRDAFDKYAADFEEYVDEFLDAEDALYEIEDEMDEIQREAIDSYLSFEDRVMDAYIRDREMQLDKLDSLQQAITSASKEIISKLQQQIEDYRKERQNQKTEKSISDKETRLAYLRRDTSGANALEIAQLEKELADARENYSDQLVDQAIQQMQADADLAATQRQQQVDALRQIHEDMKAAGEYWPAVYNLILTAFTDGTLNYNSDLVELLKRTEGYAALSEVGGQRWWDDTVASAVAAYPVLSNQFAAALGYNADMIATNEQQLRRQTDSLINEARAQVNAMHGSIYNGVLAAEQAAARAADNILAAAQALRDQKYWEDVQKDFEDWARKNGATGSGTKEDKKTPTGTDDTGGDKKTPTGTDDTGGDKKTPTGTGGETSKFEINKVDSSISNAAKKIAALGNGPVAVADVDGNVVVGAKVNNSSNNKTAINANTFDDSLVVPSAVKTTSKTTTNTSSKQSPVLIDKYGTNTKQAIVDLYDTVANLPHTNSSVITAGSLRTNTNWVGSEILSGSNAILPISSTLSSPTIAYDKISEFTGGNTNNVTIYNTINSDVDISKVTQQVTKAITNNTSSRNVNALTPIR